MTRLFLAILTVLVIIFLVPFLIYGAASIFKGLQPPAPASASRFLLGVLVTKLGTAIAFVVVFSLLKGIRGDWWLLYAAVWFLMFALSEAGDVVMGRTSGVEAILGVLSEAIYTPLAAFVTRLMIGDVNLIG